MAATITVSSSAELYKALSNAKGGETIQLAGGDYGKLALSSNAAHTFPSNITITSADPLKPATFSSFDLRDISGLTIDGVVCDYKFTPGESNTVTPFRIAGGNNITVRNCTFDGDVASGTGSSADGFGNGFGFYARGTTGLNLEDCEISNFYKGLMVFDCDDVKVTGNDVHNIRSDGMNFAQVHGGLIEGNYIHDFKASPTSVDHQDMIQFWTVSTTEPSTDIMIRGNRLDIGQGSLTQSIFMRNEMVDTGQGGEEMYYRNITITENVITNAHVNGITVGATAGLVISQNALLHADGNRPDGGDSPVEIPRIYLATRSTDVAVTGNVTSGISGWTSQPTWTVSKNAFVQDQDPGAPGYYSNVFVSSSLTPLDGVHNFLALPGGMVALLGAGPASMRNYLPEPGGVAALFQSLEDVGGSVQNRIFDASVCLSDIGPLPKGAVFEWSFGDGTIATGQKVMHHFASGGRYDVSLTVRLPSGATDTVQATIAVQSSDLITLGSDGAFRAFDYEGDIIALPATLAASSAGVQLGEKGVASTVALTHVSELQQTRDFDISMRIDADSTTSSGEIFRMHGAMIGSVNTNGEVVFTAYGDSGNKVTLTSTGVSVTNLKAHDVNISLHDGILQLWVDGKMASQAAFTGSLKDYSFYDLTFGNQWGGKNFYGDLTKFDVSIGDTSKDAATERTVLSLGQDGVFRTGDQLVSPTTLAVHMAAPAEEGSAVGLHLGDAGLVARIAGTKLSDLEQSHDFDIAMTLDADSADSTGLIFRMNNTMVARVLDNGRVFVRAFGDDGSDVRLMSADTPLKDMQSHEVDIRLHEGKLQLWIDNALSAETAFDSTLRDLDGRSLDFGNRLGYNNFDGHLTAFDITVGLDSTWSTTLL